jgi:hypothetical protein
LTLTGAASITTDGNVSFGGSVEGAHSLTVKAGSGTVTFHQAVGSALAVSQAGGSAVTGTPLSSLNVTGSSISLGAITTAGNQAYNGKVLLHADLLSQTGAITFANTVSVVAPLEIAADQINFNKAVTGTVALALLPVTKPYTEVLGGSTPSTTELILNAAELSGYQGTLYIGATPAGAIADNGVSAPVATTIVVDDPITLGSGGTLVLVSGGDIVMNSGSLSADTVVLAAVGTISNLGGPSVTVNGSSDIVVVANQISQSGQEINVNGTGGTPLTTAAVNTDVFFNELGVTEQPNGQFALTYAGDLGLVTSSNLVFTNVSSQSAANQQTGGLLTSGFIDVSVFQQISLYDVNGSGISLPADQCEEQSSTGAGCGQQ